MSAVHSTATSHAPIRVARSSDDHAPVRDSLWAHARRSWRATESALASSLLNPVIGCLLRLRKRAGVASEGVKEIDEGRLGDAGLEEDRHGTRSERQIRHGHPEHHAGGAHAVADLDSEQSDEKVPGDRRLFKLLVFLCVLVGGGMAGSALSFYLLEDLVSRSGATIEKQANAIGALERKLAEAQAKQVEAEKKLAASGVIATEKKLLEAQAKRLELEKKLEEAAKAGAERQKRLDEAAKTLGSILAAERASKSQKTGNRSNSNASENAASPSVVGMANPAGSTASASLPIARSSGSVATNSSLNGKSGSSGKASASKGGDCTLTAGNVSAGLKDCVADYKR